MFPIFADQDYNANNVERRRAGIKLEIASFTELEFRDAIQKILTDPRFVALLNTFDLPVLFLQLQKWQRYLIQSSPILISAATSGIWKP
jgi:hypothetical protein